MIYNREERDSDLSVAPWLVKKCFLDFSCSFMLAHSPLTVGWKLAPLVSLGGSAGNEEIWSWSKHHNGNTMPVLRPSD